MFVLCIRSARLIRAKRIQRVTVRAEAGHLISKYRAVWVVSLLLRCCRRGGLLVGRSREGLKRRSVALRRTTCSASDGVEVLGSYIQLLVYLFTYYLFTIHLLPYSSTHLGYSLVHSLFPFLIHALSFSRPRRFDARVLERSAARSQQSFQDGVQLPCRSVCSILFWECGRA